MAIPTHTKCCGCCCDLRIGVIVGCVLYIVFMLILIVAGSLAPNPSTERATKFCELPADYRSGYDTCYGSDLCNSCGSGSEPCGFDTEATAAAVGGIFNLVMNILAILALIGVLVSTAMTNIKMVKISGIALACMPFLILLGAIINSTLSVHGVRVSTADRYYDRALRDKICNGEVGTEDLTKVSDWDDAAETNCDEPDFIGAPDPSLTFGRGPFSSGLCDFDSQRTVGAAFGFVFVFIFFVGLLGWHIFHVYSYYVALTKAPTDGSSATSTTTTTQMQPATATATPAVAVATATPAVAVATATPAVAVATATPAVAVAVATPSVNQA